MKQKLIHSTQNSGRLLLIFSGWGGEPNLFRCDSPCDVMVCYDYRELDFDYSEIAQYAEVEVVAWSMGVFVASQIFACECPENIIFRTAINGTMTPIDDNCGIAKNVFEATLLGLLDDKTRNISLVKFRRRMCGTTQTLKEFLELSPQRPPEELAQELLAIKNHVEASKPIDFKWDRVIISTQDLIFLHANQLRAWEDIADEICEVEEPHFFKDLPYKYLAE